jgi:hypothetical protein
MGQGGGGGGGGGITSQEEVLYRSFGVQRLLDIMKQHCVYEGGARRAVGREKALELMDAAHRLLALTMSAALRSMPSTAHVFFSELQCVLLLLEETNSNEIAERLLRIVSDIRCSYPLILSAAMQNVRFNETVALHVLCGPITVPFSLEVRRSCLLTVMWNFSGHIGDIPQELLALRQCFRMLHTKTQHAKDSGGMLYSGEYAACITVKQLMKSIEKIWVNVNMLMTELKASLSPTGDWRSSTLDNNNDVHNQYVDVANARDMLDIALFDGPLGSLSPLIVIPLISTIIPTVLQRDRVCQSDLTCEGMESCQRVLMSLSVVLKTNETQTCLLSLLPDISWMKHLLSMAAVAEECRSHLQSLVSSSQAEYRSGHSDLASTCTELALDSLAQVVVFKICHHGRAAWDSILILQNLLRTKPMREFEICLSRRICTICVQKLSRLSTKQWPGDSMVTIANLLIMIEENEFCGNELIVEREHDAYAMCTGMADWMHAARGTSVDLLGIETCSLETDLDYSCQSEEEEQLLLFLFDLTASLRRMGEKEGSEVGETPLVLSMLRMIMGCLARARDETGDRICVELLANISYIAEHWLFFEGDELKRIVMGVLAQVQGAVMCLRDRQQQQALATSTLVKRYSDLVVTIAQFFVQLRFVYTEGLPLHVISTVESLRYCVSVCTLHNICYGIMFLAYIFIRLCDSLAALV